MRSDLAVKQNAGSKHTWIVRLSSGPPPGRRRAGIDPAFQVSREFKLNGLGCHEAPFIIKTRRARLRRIPLLNQRHINYPLNLKSSCDVSLHRFYMAPPLLKALGVF